MGLVCDYFLAPSDTAAAATIDRVGGPGRLTPPKPEARRSIFRRRSRDTPAAAQAPIFPTLDSGGIEPVVQLGQLEALLTERTIEAVLDANLIHEPVAIRGEGELLVLKVSDTLTTTLAEATAADLTRVAQPWSEIEEFGGLVDADALAAFLDDLAALARMGRERGEGLYCWLSV